MIIFPRKKCTEPMLLEAPPGFIGGANPLLLLNYILLISKIRDNYITCSKQD